MNPTKEAALLMSSLSIFRGITERTVIKAYYELLCSVDKPVFQFAQAWGSFFSLLCERECTEDFARYMTETALYDENACCHVADAKVQILSLWNWLSRKAKKGMFKSRILFKKGWQHGNTCLYEIMNRKLALAHKL